MWQASNRRFYDSNGNLVGKPSMMTTSKGREQPCAKLSDEQVVLILRLSKSGLSYNKIAKMFEVNSSTIGQIINGHTYKYIDRSNIEPYITFDEEINLEKLEL
jgi:DNA invertase Pin-like site-specific DNA recombinase